jgi:vacuolar protein-sorting-associated protein 4
VKQLFKMAREQKPAVIFIDEIDSVAGERSGSGGQQSEGQRKALTELLVQMDGVGHDDTGVLLIGATNLPWELDQAIKRR